MGVSYIIETWPQNTILYFIQNYGIFLTYIHYIQFFPRTLRFYFILILVHHQTHSLLFDIEYSKYVQFLQQLSNVWKHAHTLNLYSVPIFERDQKRFTYYDSTSVNNGKLRINFCNETASDINLSVFRTQLETCRSLHLSKKEAKHTQSNFNIITFRKLTMFGIRSS